MVLSSRHTRPLRVMDVIVGFRRNFYLERGSLPITHLTSLVRYARKDRRPLDPPPVVQLKLFDVTKRGNETYDVEFDNYESVLNQVRASNCLTNSIRSDLQGFGLLCHVDLFPVPTGPAVENSSPASTPNKRRRRSEELLPYRQ